ncbi:MAG: four helix bundle protein [Cyclobacteriaceae bacterium]|nr:four helix bundle protein [Cyclobacteriaceae bacterium]
MFDFEKLEVYCKLKELNIKVLIRLKSNRQIDPYLSDQWKRATLSIALNLAEGSGRISSADKKHFYTIARSSVYECVAIVDILSETEEIDKGFAEDVYASYEEVSKMLLGLYRATTG